MRGAGFIGSNTAKILLLRGNDAVIVDEMNNYYDAIIKECNLSCLEGLVKRSPHCLYIYKGDICDKDFIINLFEKEYNQ